MLTAARRPADDPWLGPLTYGDASALGRPTDIEEWPVPDRVWLEGPDLVWKFEKSGSREAVEDLRRADLLSAFIALHEESDDAIVHFARRYGTLWLCRHEWPYTHNVVAPFGSSGTSGCSVNADIVSGCHEPLAVWRRFSEQARALLTIGAKLQSGEVDLITGDDWGLVVSEWRLFRKGANALAKSTIHVQQAHWSRVVGWWMLAGGVGLFPTFTWEANKGNSAPHVTTLSRSGVFGAIGLQLMTTLTGQNIARCDSCGRIYIPRRKPRADQAKRCQSPDCRNRHRWRTSQQKARRASEKEDES